MTPDSTRPEPLDDGPFFHATKADLRPGDLLHPGRSSNFGRRVTANFAYLTATMDAAIWGTELALGDAPGRIYRVEPTGEFANPKSCRGDGDGSLTAAPHRIPAGTAAARQRISSVAMDVDDIKAALEDDRATTLVQRDRLARDLDEVFAAAADVATDDEHDPEGATIAYERSRARALLEQADAHLGDITLALERIEAGDYGTCVQCGNAIGTARLRARPVVGTCITCAAQ